jgi:hypothetical protein
VPVVIGELDVHTELPLPLPGFLPHQQLLLVGLQLDHISFFKLASRVNTVVLLVGVGKCLAIILKKETAMANFFGFVNSISTVL